MNPILQGSARAATALAAAALSVSTLGISLIAVAPAHADTASTNDGASVTVADVVSSGNAIHIEGTGWKHPGTGKGSTIAVKLGDALGTEPKGGPVTNPADGSSADAFDVWDAVKASDDGSFSADIAFPTPDNTSPALPSPWAVGTTHQLRLLTGSMVSGDQPRGALLTFTIGAGLVSTATTTATGQVTVTYSGGTFPAGEVLTVARGAEALKWTVRSGRTSTVEDTLTVGDAGTISASVVLPSGAATAGDLTLTVKGDQGTDRDVTTTVPPSVAFSGGTALGSTGTLTIGNLVTGTTLSSVKLGDVTLASNLTADATGAATATYAIPATLSPVTQPLVITQAAPEPRTYSLTQAVYPNESSVGAGRFDLASSTATFYQGFYQSAYSPKEHALYVTSSDRGSGNAGVIYKLNPDTLAIEASKETVYADFPRAGAFGVGVDDVHGNVWVTNTGAASVAVYRESDLSLVKQHPAATITHPRDIVFDEAHDIVFASSASEGSSATAAGYISVFEADDKNGNGTKYEKLVDIQTGTRDLFNPVSLSLAGGKLFSPSLGSNKVLAIDTARVLDAGYEPTFLTVPGIDVGGRGASGIAYDPADDRLFIASQNTNEVVIADATTGATIKEIPTGRQALNVVFDQVHRLAYVSNFGGTSVTVLDPDGRKVAALPIATANHISLDDKGNAYVVDKAPGNRVWKITPRIETLGGVEIANTSSTSATGNAATTPLTVTVKKGQPIRLEGTNFRAADGASGSKIAVKTASTSAAPIIAEIQADDQGSWSADVPFPAEWEVGESQHLRLLTGSLKPGDTGRSIAVKVRVEAATSVETPPASNPAPAGQTPPAANPATQALQERIAKATQLVTATEARLADLHKKIVSVKTKRTKAAKQLAAAKKASKTGSAKARAAAKKRVAKLTKQVKNYDKQVKGLKTKQTTTKKQLAQNQAALTGLRK